jgi:hypothetical protein
MRKPFSGQKKPVKLGRVIIFLTFDALDRILGFSKRGQVQVHRNLMTIFWSLQNHIKSVTFRRIVVCRPKSMHDESAMWRHQGAAILQFQVQSVLPKPQSEASRALHPELNFHALPVAAEPPGQDTAVKEVGS